MNRDLAITIYLSVAAVAGALCAIPRLSQVVWIGSIVVFGFGSTLFRMRVLHEPGWSRHEIDWLAIFAAVWLSVSFVLRSGPF